MSAPPSPASLALEQHVEALLEAERWAEYRAVMAAAVAAAPDDPDILLFAASCTSDAVEGGDYARRAAELVPNDSSRLLRAVDQLLRHRDYAAARTWLMVISELEDAQLAGFTLGLVGRLAAGLGHDEQAERALRMAFESERDYARHGLHLARFYLDGGRATEALEVLADAERACPGHGELRALRGEVLGQFHR